MFSYYAWFLLKLFVDTVIQNVVFTITGDPVKHYVNGGHIAHIVVYQHCLISKLLENDVSYQLHTCIARQEAFAG